MRRIPFIDLDEHAAAMRTVGEYSTLFPLTNGRENSMNVVQKLLAGAGTAAMLAFASGASAAPVLFTITGAKYVSGSGYGIDNDEASANLLDVRFSTNLFSSQSFALSVVNQSFTFNFGSVDLQEPEVHSGIMAGELDDLGLTAKLTFGGPTGLIQTLDATGVATIGPLLDSEVDLVFDWSPVEISFGNGGIFRLSLADMAFSRVGSQTQTATVTLLSLPGDLPPVSTVAEPPSLALVGIGVGCCLLTRRRRNKGTKA